MISTDTEVRIKFKILEQINVEKLDFYRIWKSHSHVVQIISRKWSSEFNIFLNRNL